MSSKWPCSWKINDMGRDKYFGSIFKLTRYTVFIHVPHSLPIGYNPKITFPNFFKNFEEPGVSKCAAIHIKSKNYLFTKFRFLQIWNFSTTLNRFIEFVFNITRIAIVLEAFEVEDWKLDFWWKSPCLRYGRICVFMWFAEFWFGAQ